MTEKLQFAARQALEVLEEAYAAQFETTWFEIKPEHFTALREALAEPELNLNCKSVQKRLATTWGYVKAEQAEREHVAEVHNTDTPSNWSIIKPGLPAGTKLYASPIRTKDLTDDEERQVITATVEGVTTSELVMFKAVARAVIAADRELNK